MKVHGDYRGAGYAHLEQLVPAEVAAALLDLFWRDLMGEKLPVRFETNELLTRPAVELYGSKSPGLTTFMWGLTPTMTKLTGSDLLPSYAFFRLYTTGDRLLVHNDRDACEHSLSLTLGYSEGKPWHFDVGHGESPPKAKPADDFGEEPYSTIAMAAGDAVLYKGIQRRHGRLVPNPNQWSAHLFMHWVDRNGPHAKHAFERWPEAAQPAP